MYLLTYLPIISNRSYYTTFTASNRMMLYSISNLLKKAVSYARSSLDLLSSSSTDEGHDSWLAFFIFSSTVFRIILVAKARKRLSKNSIYEKTFCDNDDLNFTIHNYNETNTFTEMYLDMGFQMLSLLMLVLSHSKQTTHFCKAITSSFIKWHTSS